MKDFNIKKLTSQRLFLPVFCLVLVLLVNIMTTPDFFSISIRDGVLYGYIIDIINPCIGTGDLAIGMTLVVSASAGTDISVGAIMAVSAAVCCNILNWRRACGYRVCKSSDPWFSCSTGNRYADRIL